ncbi:MAG: phosphoribosylformylglycinamidine synthase II, partial [Halobacteriales archaeon SW_9_67_25]
ATHDVSHGGLGVALAEMVHSGGGAQVSVGNRGPPVDDGRPAAALFHELPGRVVVETADPGGVRAAFDGIAPVAGIGVANGSGTLSLSAGNATLSRDAGDVAALRSVITDELE